MIIKQQEIEDHREELLNRSHKDIEQITAIKWGARAIAAYELVFETLSLEMYADAEDYFREALEHAAQVGYIALREIEGQIANYRIQAIRALKER